MIAEVSDKTEHVVTFVALTMLAIAAYPRAMLAAQAFILSGFGAMIEFIQPYFGRDKDAKDWIADTIGIVIAMAIVWTMRRLVPALRANT
ncbi:MAG: VanZ family protein [Proteobacteria bacterium]|nr:VanZ family protein [Pseudomonadota bacterium]